MYEFSYVDLDETRSKNERVSDQVVMVLLKPHLNKKRNVTFETIKAAIQLQNKELSRKQWKNAYRSAFSGEHTKEHFTLHFINLMMKHWLFI